MGPMEWSGFDSLGPWLYPNLPPAPNWLKDLEQVPAVGDWQGDFEKWLKQLEQVPEVGDWQGDFEDWLKELAQVPGVGDWRGDFENNNIGHGEEVAALDWLKDLQQVPAVGGWWGDFANNNVGHGQEVAAVSHVQPVGHADQEMKQREEEEEWRLFIQSAQQAQPRRPRVGFAWTEKEHKLFLIGLMLFGKGDWKDISKMCVKSRNPTQVASHAQKYYKRREMMSRSTPSPRGGGGLGGGGRRRRRSSIHDIELDFTDFDSIVALMPNILQILPCATNASAVEALWCGEGRRSRRRQNSIFISAGPMEWSDFDSLERWLRPNVPPALEWWEELEPEVGYWWGDFANNNEVAAVRHVQPADHGDQEIKEEGRRLRIQPQPRRPGLAWTEKEHKLFLMGLKIFGKGDWKSVSRMCVKSKNPTQVASHAQKYFKRREMMGRRSPSPGGGGGGGGGRRRRRRSSIHDTQLDFSDVDSINALMPNLSQILFYANNASTAAPSSSSSSNC